MKKFNWNIIKLILLVVLSGILYAFANHKSGQKNLTDVTISFKEGKGIFISYHSVHNLLTQDEGNVKDITRKKLDLNILENNLKNHPMIEDAEIYTTVNGKLISYVKQRMPIARVQGVSSFYIDNRGKKMPLSKEFTARVPLVSGQVDPKNLQEIFAVADFIKKDEFLKKSIIHLQVNNSVFQLHLRQVDFILDLGKAKHLKRKFNYFKAFYKKAKKDNLLHKYSKINLRYNNQVVCTKK